MLYFDPKSKKEEKVILSKNESYGLVKGQVPVEVKQSPLKLFFEISNYFMYGNVVNTIKDTTDLVEITPNITYNFNKDNYLHLRLRAYYLFFLRDSENDDIKKEYLNVENFFFKSELDGFNLIFGRSNYFLGNGLIFNNIGDGLELGINTDIIDIKFFTCYSGIIDKISDNIDPFRSVSDNYNNKHRIFAGTELLFFPSSMGYKHHIFTNFYVSS